MCQAQSSLPRSQDRCPSSGAEEKQLNLRAVATETLDGKLGAQGFDMRRGWLFLGIQVLYVPLDPRQLGVSTELLPFLGDEAVGKKSKGLVGDLARSLCEEVSVGDQGSQLLTLGARTSLVSSLSVHSGFLPLGDRTTMEYGVPCSSYGLLVRQRRPCF